LRCTDGASRVHEAAYWSAEYRPRNCLAAVLAAAAVSGWAAGAGVLAAAAVAGAAGLAAAGAAAGVARGLKHPAAIKAAAATAAPASLRLIRGL